MFPARILFRRSSKVLLNFTCQHFKSSSDDHAGKNVLFLGGGLEKLQGSIKEEEYFTSMNYELATKIRECSRNTMKEANDQHNWDEYHKSLNNSAFQDSCLMNKHKDCKEEAYFMAESAECLQLVKDRFNSEESGDDNNTKDVNDAKSDCVEEIDIKTN